MEEQKITGSCLCGACTYSTDAQPIDIRACHCSLCQKATGAPLYARVKVPLDSVTMSGPIGGFSSSPEVERGFCTQCGTSLFSKRAAVNQIGLTMGSLDNPDRFQPSDQIWISKRQAWLARTDDLPGYREGPPT